MRSNRTSFALVIIVAALCPAFAQAVNYSWSDAVSGLYSDPSRWSPEGTPQPGDTIRFDAGANTPYLVAFEKDSLIGRIIVGNDDLEFDAVTESDSGYDLFHHGLVVGDANGQVGSLTVYRLNSFEYLPFASGSAARIGNEIGSQGILTFDGSRGTTFFDASSGEVIVGNAGSGTLVFRGGATAQATRTAVVGQDATAKGRAFIEGVGSLWEAFDAIVGEHGSGEISITNGGLFGSIYMTLGNSADGTGTVTVNGTKSNFWSDFLSLGNEGSGKLVIENGADITLAFLDMAIQPGSKGSIVIDGAATRLTTWTGANVGIGGSASIEVRNGAKVNSPSPFKGVQSLQCRELCGDFEAKGGFLIFSSGV